MSGSAQAASNPRYASIVVDADTGAILHQRYANKQLHPASLAKMMTLLLTFEELKKGNLRLNQRIVISPRAASMVPSKINLPAGSTIRVKDAMYILVTKSANDVAVALAEAISGTESQFAENMTRKAWSIGMKHTRFRNASGLHDRRQITTAKDMAILARYIIKRYPGYYHYFDTKKYSFNGKTYRNHNRLMETYAGMDGMKTGYISASGFNLVASAERDGRRVIGVVFGGRTAKTRNAHMKVLMDRGFKKVERTFYASIQKTPPLPGKKPGDSTFMMASADGFNRIMPSSGRTASSDYGLNDGKWTKGVTPALSREAFVNLVGQGDFDPDIADRLETGLLAMAALKSSNYSSKTVTRTYPAGFQTASYQPKVQRKGQWAVQVGAFRAHDKTLSAIQRARKQLPSQYQTASDAIMPLKGNDSWLYRGRLVGFSQKEAVDVCRYLNPCMVVGPR